MPEMSPFERFGTAPAKSGLYDPSRDKDACGLAMVATLRGIPGHDIVDTALNALRNLEHRGAVGSDAGTGDGAGILTQIPDAFFRAVVDFELPAKGFYAAGLVFVEEGKEPVLAPIFLMYYQMSITELTAAETGDEVEFQPLEDGSWQSITRPKEERLQITF